MYRFRRMYLAVPGSLFVVSHPPVSLCLCRGQELGWSSVDAAVFDSLGGRWLVEPDVDVFFLRPVRELDPVEAGSLDRVSTALSGRAVQRSARRVRIVRLDPRGCGPDDRFWRVLRPIWGQSPVRGAGLPEG